MSVRSSFSSAVRTRATQRFPQRLITAALSRAFAVLPAFGVVVSLPAVGVAQPVSAGRDVRAEALPATHRAARKQISAVKRSASPAKLEAAAPPRDSSRALAGDSGNSCTAAPGCVIVITEPTAGHSATGPTGGSIAHVFSGPQTLRPTSFGAFPVGAIFFSSTGGKGGDADSSGGNGGQGGVGGEVGNIGSPVTLQTRVTATGDSTLFPLAVFGSVGANGGGGQGASSESRVGTGGQGGAGGAVTILMNGTIGGGSGDGLVGGLLATTTGGTGGSGEDGGLDHYAPHAGAGGTGGAVMVTIGGTVTTIGFGAGIESNGGAGAAGPNDTEGISNAIGSDGGTGGSAGIAQLTVSGTVASSTSDGAVVVASGGIGGTGGSASGAPSVDAGNGGTGGGGTLAILTISGTVQGARAGGSATAQGGNGGAGGIANGSFSSGDSGRGGAGGDGGNAGLALATVQQGASVVGGQTGLIATAAGGNGGAGGSGAGSGATGGNGGAGGNGGNASAEIAGSVSGATGASVVGVAALSYGGSGGAGARSTGGQLSDGGTGGKGGAAGAAAILVDASGSVTTTAPDTPKTSTAVAPAILARSNGGVGGVGGNASAGIGPEGGSAGAGGAGATATVAVAGNVGTSGSFAYGVLAQSIGGAGAGGGDASGLFGARGGVARNGGAAGAVYVNGSGGSIATSGTGASAIVGQSIGGGGGAGGNATGGGLAIGGNGGAGGNGNTVAIGLTGDSQSKVLNDLLVTRGDSAAAIVAQSVGGAGGNGGNAIAFSPGPVSLAIGGDGKGGGIGGTVGVTNDGVVTTFGAHSGGIAAQSVGGGGGNGGTGVAITASVVATSFALGGDGGGGGVGGPVALTNDSQITTYGSDSYGMKAQSVAGGGGQGGAALATAIALSPDPEIPAVSVSVGIGGSGGAGGDQSGVPVTLVNHGLVTTSGAGSIGVFAQSIGGGGGNGGDSTASSYANGGKDGISVSASASVGGRGGSGGVGGPVDVTSDGLVVTLGEYAHGIEAQSVGGGGGTGGIGDSSASAGSGENSYSGTVAVGGNGGAASLGGAVTVTNAASIATRGDGARAIFAQSVGGGGGASGGGTAKANGDTLSLGVTVGGNGGKGGNGGSVTVTNQQTLLTRGTDADAIFAQSVGGGGGLAGKGSSSAGGAQDPKDVVHDLATTIANGLNLGQTAVKLADGVYKVGDGALKGIDQISQLAGILGGDGAERLRGDDDEDGTATSIKLNATVGGQGGAGGNGGVIVVTNSGVVQTEGARSDGIFAQSVGGGGGVGGASSFSASASSGDASSSGDHAATLSVGGSGAGAGNGQGVTVTNNAGATITTKGVTTYGIAAQSIGGGGGKAGMTGASDGALKDLAVTVGGSGGVGGTGGTVSVANSGVITVQERQSVGILAQSAGGGGGTAHVLSSDNGAPSAAGDDIHVMVGIGGSGGAGGDGGAVTVTHGQASGASITTAGVGGIGIVAQSIGGGGGLLVATSAVPDSAGGGDGITDGTVVPIRIGGTGGASGNGGTVSVAVDAPQGVMKTPYVATSNVDAYGMLAQSIGGGGGLATGTTPGTSLGALFGSSAQRGNGGAVTVAMADSGWIYTSGKGSAGIVAQSFGGGGAMLGGLSNVDLTSGVRANPTPQSGQGGNVTVTLDSGSNIVTAGALAHGIVVQAFGGGGGVVGAPNGTGYAFAGATPYANCGGSCTGAVAVTLGPNTVVRAMGSGAYGIIAQSHGNGVNTTTVTLNGGHAESWGLSAGAIFVDGTGTNTIDNNGGVIDNGTLNKAPTKSGLAIAASSSAGFVTVNNTGTIYGSFSFPNGGMINNRVGAFLQAPTVGLGGRGVLINAGTIDVGGQATTTMRVNGDLVQQPSGTLVLDIDPANQRNDVVRVDGRARLDGLLLLRAASLTPDPIAVVQSGGTPDATGLRVTDTGGGRLFGYSASSRAGGVTVTPSASLDTSARDQSLGGGRVSLADHLQAGFVHGLSPAQATLYAQLAALPDGQSYRLALDNLSGETLQAAAVAAHASSLAFAERMNDCPALDGQGSLTEHRCGWLRVIENRTHRGASNDSAGFSNDTQTVQAGGQTDVADGWFVGGSLGYEHSRTSAAETAGSVSGDGGSVGVVVKRELGPWLLALGADYGHGRYDTRRTIVVGSIQSSATGAYDLSHAGVHGRVAYRLVRSDWYLKPYVDGHVVWMRSGGFDESGAGDLDLRVDARTGTIYSLSPMVELGTRRTFDNGVRLNGFVALGALLQSGARWGASSRLEGSSGAAAPFNAMAELPNRQGKAGLGVDVGWKNKTLRLEYGGAFGSGYSSQGASAKLAIMF